MKIINGDSLEVLKRATANSIDAVVTDEERDKVMLSVIDKATQDQKDLLQNH